MGIQKQSASRGPSSKRWGKILVLFVMVMAIFNVQMLGFPEIPTLQTSFGIVSDVIGDNSLPNASSHSSIVGLPISGESEVGNRQSSGNSDDAGKLTDTEFRALWPRIQDELCPENKPNVALGARMFQLAAKELNITNSRQPWMSDFFIKFFMPGQRRKECRTILKAGMQVCYVDIWKCANREIRGYLQALMGKETAPNAKMTQCWFTVVRDPVERFLSGYNEIERRLLWEGFENVAREYPFRKKRIPSEERFVQFVADILQRTGRGHGHPVFRHVYSMSGVLLRKDAPPAYLPTIRNLTLALPLFLKRECDGFGDLDGDPALMDAMPREGELQRDRLSGNDPLGTYAASRSAWMRQGPASRALCLIVAMDYACWRNLEGVPPLCKDVFVGDDLVYLARNSTQHI